MAARYQLMRGRRVGGGRHSLPPGQGVEALCGAAEGVVLVVRLIRVLGFLTAGPRALVEGTADDVAARASGRHASACGGLRLRGLRTAHSTGRGGVVHCAVHAATASLAASLALVIHRYQHRSGGFLGAPRGVGQDRVNPGARRRRPVRFSNLDLALGATFTPSRRIDGPWSCGGRRMGLQRQPWAMRGRSVRSWPRRPAQPSGRLGDGPHRVVARRPPCPGLALTLTRTARTKPRRPSPRPGFGTPAEKAMDTPRAAQGVRRGADRAAPTGLADVVDVVGQDRHEQLIRSSRGGRWPAGCATVGPVAGRRQALRHRCRPGPQEPVGHLAGRLPDWEESSARAGTSRSRRARARSRSRSMSAAAKRRPPGAARPGRTGPRRAPPCRCGPRWAEVVDGAPVRGLSNHRDDVVAAGQASANRSTVMKARPPGANSSVRNASGRAR